ncbi:MAG TPA: SUMF1/EgtB/PvdO family nonheme iron enzyme [Candidatus Aquilonibacter sp.]|nr:SUMF1/EgtB/PvdO family nonheme iron enzyme [Candidatus Aquilonibacter sp.]
MLATQSNTVGRRRLHDRLLTARRRSDELFAVVRPAFLYERPIPERHRIVFYIGHLEAFDWNLLHERVLGLQSSDPEFDRLFAFGIDPVGGGLPCDQPHDWPAIDRVRGYASEIRKSLDTHLAEGALDESQDYQGFALDTLLNVAIEHRLMHVETLAYMFHQLPVEQKIAQKESLEMATAPVAHRMIDIPPGEATVGLPRSSGIFGWDNEFEEHSVSVPAFAIDQFKVTNRQFLDFISAGGYETPAFWSEQDWKWKSAQDISHPVFWKRYGKQWLYRTMFSEIPLQLDWPVYVSHAEASAYARWTGKALPSENEWQRAACGTGADEPAYPWGNDHPNSQRGNFDFVRWNPTPVNAFPEGQSPFGVHDMLGNGWEWTSTPFAPHPGFRAFPFYPGYSADFFDGKHFVMKGGSGQTSACMLRRSFRNWFQAHYQYAYSGFRCVTR